MYAIVCFVIIEIKALVSYSLILYLYSETQSMHGIKIIFRSDTGLCCESCDASNQRKQSQHRVSINK